MSPRAPKTPSPRVRRATATASFGSSRRESHDASAFYERFVGPELTDDTTVVTPKKVDTARVTRKLTETSRSVAAVWSSPWSEVGRRMAVATRGSS